MIVHHLNCGAMQPYGGHLFDGQTPGLGPATLACHCLLLNTGTRLVLVDTGVVGADAALSARRHSTLLRVVDRLRLDSTESAAHQVIALGYRPADVTDIIMTHLDFDHAAGMTDFPQARIHVAAAEAQAALHPAGPVARARYRPGQLQPTLPRWNQYAEFGAAWLGLPAVPVDGVDGVWLVNLPGHSAGHCGVAVPERDGWLLHAGDAIFHHRELDAAPFTPTAARAYQWAIQHSQRQRRRSLHELRRLARDSAGNVRVICTHDPSLLP